VPLTVCPAISLTANDKKTGTVKTHCSRCNPVKLLILTYVHRFKSKPIFYIYFLHKKNNVIKTWHHDGNEFVTPRQIYLPRQAVKKIQLHMSPQEEISETLRKLYKA
jgi:hypothetical protein